MGELHCGQGKAYIESTKVPDQLQSVDLATGIFITRRIIFKPSGLVLNARHAEPKSGWMGVGGGCWWGSCAVLGVDREHQGGSSQLQNMDLATDLFITHRGIYFYTKRLGFECA